MWLHAANQESVGTALGYFLYGTSEKERWAETWQVYSKHSGAFAQFIVMGSNWQISRLPFSSENDQFFMWRDLKYLKYSKSEFFCDLSICKKILVLNNLVLYNIHTIDPPTILLFCWSSHGKVSSHFYFCTSEPVLKYFNGKKFPFYGIYIYINIPTNNARKQHVSV